MHLQEATLASKTRTLVAIEELERLVPVLKVGPLQLSKSCTPQCCSPPHCSLAVPERACSDGHSPTKLVWL